MTSPFRKRHAVLKGSMTRLVTYCNEINMDTNVEDIRARLLRLNELQRDFIENENELFINDADFESEMELFENKYYHVVAILNTWIRQLSVNEIQPNNGKDNVRAEKNDFKLPRINILPFNGNYKDWFSFHDLYLSSVHENNAIPAVQKFQYLKSLLQGEALNLVKHFAVTEVNYIEAFQRLCQRYNRKNSIMTSFIKSFLDQPALKFANAINFRKLCDTTDEVLRGLKALGQKAEARDPWLIYIIFNKMDEDSQRLWVQQIGDTDFPTVDNLLNFLNKRANMLETLKPESASHSRPAISKHVPVKSLHVSSDASQVNCPMCKQAHKLYECSTFQALSIADRRSRVKELGRCFNCLSDTHIVVKCRYKKRCIKCNRKHHSILHLDEPSVSNPSSNIAIPNNEHDNGVVQCGMATSQNCNVLNNRMNYVTQFPVGILPTAIVKIQDSTKGVQTGRILLDSGSQLSFISEACVQRLCLPRSHAKIAVNGVASVSAAVTRGVTKIKLISRINPEASVEIMAFILSSVSSLIPATPFKLVADEKLKSIEMADPTYNIPSHIDILVGINQFLKILKPGQILNEQHDPVAQETIFGWVIAGEISNQGNSSYHIVNDTSEEVDIDQTLKRFWEIEDLPKEKLLTEEEKMCEEHFEENFRRNEDGKFIVRLPFKKLNIELGDSQWLAMKRMKFMQCRFQRDKHFSEQYHKFMEEYESLGHMEVISQNITEKNRKPVFYLPHHGVLKETSSTTKLRVVFDASARSSTDNSLNDYLMIGPTVQQPLLNIMQRFRLYKFVVTADIEKMYRQVLVDKRDTDFQRIIWQPYENEAAKHFKLLTVTYGTASAPYLATKVLSKLAEINKKEYPEVANIIKNNFYIDDLLTGANTIEDAQKLAKELKWILNTAGFNLRKWASNNNECLNGIPEEDKELKNVEVTLEASLKLLGLEWNPTLDRFKFKFNLEPKLSCTKRKILSEAARIFDPLGWLTPTTVRIKIFFQQLWVLNLDWDQNLPLDVQHQWNIIRSDLELLKSVEIHRWLQTESEDIQLHGFADASEKAYAAVVYCRIVNPDETVTVNLVTSKSKVAPIKQLSIPRLELCAAVLLTNLITTTKKAFEDKKIEIFCWSDSTIVLSWLSAHPRKWKTFVGNRTSEILEHFNRKDWRHVSSENNPADCASRGISASELINHDMWWRGPNWLKNIQTTWDHQLLNFDENTFEEERKTQIVQTHTATKKNCIFQNLNDRISKFSRMIRIIARVRRFMLAKKLKIPLNSMLTSSELKIAHLRIIQWMQYEDFFEEIEALKLSKPLKKSSKLRALNPFLDIDGNLRVGGRIENSTATFEVKHPLIISSHHCVTEKIVRYYHLKDHHAGPTLLINNLKQIYWILGCRNIARKVTHTCVTCTRYRKNPEASQIMGNLPEERVTLVRPFLKTGVDYAGPISLKLLKGRNQKTFKAYICIFVCLSVKAVHIELVSELTSEAFIAAFRRFVARRGICTDMFSDNGTNFVGANKSLKEMYNFIKNNNNFISTSLLEHQINWHFIPPATPHFGGLWEAAVKSTKYHLKRIVGDQILTYEEMLTLLTQIESLLNSRPLCVNSTEDIDVLTPSHFLIGHPHTLVPDPNLMDIKMSRLSRYQMIQQMLQHFWKRWHIEYLTALQNRRKWQLKNTNIKLDDIVLIIEDNIPANKWSYGRVIELHPGKDDIVRVVSLKTKTGILKRSINKICVLPLH